jgi:murein DD-endopeptidase MepM/ murein hydrolase activator NlpD
MKKLYPILFLAIIAVLAYFILHKKPTAVSNPVLNEAQSPQTIAPTQNPANSQNINVQNNQSATGFQPPLSRANERVTKKPFGIYITSQTSPVQPERFQGYHTGTDFEIFPEELNADVPVWAVCSGKLALKEYASGYGGVAVESCQLNNQPITVIYGHLNLASISAKAGDNLNAGDVLGNLGNAYSKQTDGERKHLHLGFHKGTAISILGYVSSQSQLSSWLDACQYVCL